ncbi:coiled-coil domain-containing protein [Methanoculleus sp. 7T]|uniref:hypothetical protein n=1 Tax=Methanoculleus sp. 7T TaxID=2937282 RepID=UPI0020BEF3C2|nr:hypothetical protein [Methanoculleus sp. 7T]MCK8519268.1 hypothetical protein [Methanoculleus sp. 7T]
MISPKKFPNLRCCIGIPVRFSEQEIKILRIADISTTDWTKSRVNTVGIIYTKPDGGPMLLPVRKENNSIHFEHDTIGIWTWKESATPDEYNVIPFLSLPKPPHCKYNYYELIFLENSKLSSESPGNLRFAIGSDDELVHILEKGIVVPDTFSENLLVVYDYDEEFYFCIEITKAASCLRDDQLLFVTDKKPLVRCKIKKEDVIDSFDPQYKTLLSENHTNLTRRLIYQKMRIAPQDKLDTLELHTDSAVLAKYFDRIATRLSYSEDEKRLMKNILIEALSSPKGQPALALSPENKQWLDSQIEIINSYLDTDDKVEGFVRGVIDHIPKINEEYINKIRHIANQGLFEQKESLEAEIADLEDRIEDIKGEILAIAAERTAETDALKSLKKTVESESERIRQDHEKRIQQELKAFEKEQKNIAVEEIAVFKKERLQAIAKESEQFRLEQQNIILNELQSLREESNRLQNDIAILKASREQLEKDIADRQRIREELAQLERDKRTLEAINDQLKSYCEQRFKDIQHNPGRVLGDLALFKGLMPTRESEKASIASVSNSGLLIRPAEDYGADPLEITDLKDLIYDLKENLQNIGVDQEYAEILAEFIAGAYLTRTPLLLAGCNVSLMAKAISVTLCSQTPEIISVPTGYTDYSSLINTVKTASGNVVLLQNVIGSIDEYCYAHLAKDMADKNPEKYILYSLDFAETMRILPPSLLGYVAFMNSDDVITSVETEDLNPGYCTIVAPVEKQGNIKSIYQKIFKLSRAVNATNGYNLTRTAIVSTVATNDGKNVETIILLELATYCKLLGTIDELNQGLEYLDRDDLKKIVDKLLGGE